MQYLILHNIRSAENVGSMFRSADAFGVSKIFVTGYTPAPVDRFKRPVGKIAKTALGAEQTVPWERGEVGDIVVRLKEQQVRVIVLEQAPHATSLDTYVRNLGFGQGGWALIVGNEVSGVDQETLALADDVVEISMWGTKESLNVAVAGGIALYALTASNSPSRPPHQSRRLT